MGYIQELRALVGSRPLVMVGATVLVLNEHGELLMALRSDNNMWGVIGGALEPGESLEENARREAYEEAGLELGALELFGAFSGEGFFYEYPNGDQVHIVSVVYVCRTFSGNPYPADGEHRRLQWFSLRALPEAISPTVIPILQVLIERSQT